ncbi:MAG TPA: Clp protease N-terminal domain-containing protein [Acidimicrobiales bacterium]|nr:Clp protease N-terminal domain-containing protein [Acidimicrobiales bacterium]
MFERFTDRARSVLVLAQGQAGSLGHNYIGTEHILLGLAVEGTGVGAKVLESFDVTPAHIRSRIAALTGQPAPAEGGKVRKPPFTPRAKKALEASLKEALLLGHNYIGTEHLLLGVAYLSDGVGAKILDEAGVTAAAVREQVMAILAAYIGNTVSPGTEMVAEALIGDRGAGSSPSAEPAPTSPGWSPALERIMARAAELAAPIGVVTSTDVLLATLEEAESRGARVLAALGVGPAQLEDQLARVPLEGTSDAEAVPEVSVTVGDRTAVVDADLAARLRGAGPEEILAALRRGLGPDFRPSGP